MVDVLSFVDGARSVLAGEEAEGFSRQIAINGALLADPEDHSTLLHPEVSIRARRRYLRQLLGEQSSDEVESGRIPLGYCAACLQNDGWIFATSAQFATGTVTWARLGFDIENGFPVTRTGPWWWRRKERAPADWKWWTIEPDDPELIYTFDRFRL